MNEKEILHTALNALQQTFAAKWDWAPMNAKGGIDIDGMLNITLKEHAYTFETEIRKELKNHQLLHIIGQNQKFDKYLLIAERLYPNVKKELRKNKVNYLEANGDGYIEDRYLNLWIEKNEPLAVKRKTGNRAFTKTGLKVVFHFLMNPKLLNLTQREIAKVADVALGNIPQVINGLLETNYLLRKDKRKYIIKDYRELLEKWIDEYDETLRPTIFKQRFTFMNVEQDWRNLPLNTDKTVWGCEPAGDILTNYLRPEVLVLYTTEATKDLIKNYKIMPNKDGNIWVYEAFWNFKDNLQNTAPPILVYADLMLTGDKRCIETANLIFDEHIQPKL